MYAATSHRLTATFSLQTHLNITALQYPASFVLLLISHPMTKRPWIHRKGLVSDV